MASDEVEGALRARRSIRRYTDEPVSEEVVRQILDEARWAPSWRNMQAWRVWVVTGRPLARFKETFGQSMSRDAPACPDIPMTTQWPPEYMARAERLMNERTAFVAASGEPVDTPEEAKARVADLFGAPCMLVFGVDARIAEAYATFDTGLLVQSVCLAAHGRGLGTCIMATPVRHCAALREVVPEHEDTRFVVVVALGHPVADAAINHFARERAELDEFVRWVS